MGAWWLSISKHAPDCKELGPAAAGLGVVAREGSNIGRAMVHARAETGGEASSATRTETVPSTLVQLMVGTKVKDLMPCVK